MNEALKIFTLYRAKILPIVLLPLGLGILFFGVYPIGKQAMQTYRAIEGAQDEVNRLKKKLSMLTSLDETTLYNQLELTTSSVPLDKSLPTVLNTVESVAADVGASVSDLVLSSPGSLATQSATSAPKTDLTFGAYVLKFTVTLEGENDAILSFLDSIVSVRRLTRVRSFDIQYSKEIPRLVAAMDTLYSPIAGSSSVSEVRPLTTQEESLLNLLANQPNKGEALLESLRPFDAGSGIKTNPFAPF